MFTVRDLQEMLKAEGFKDLVADNIRGKHTLRAMEQVLDKAGVIVTGSWTDDRIQLAVTQYFLKKLGCNPGAIDGLLGQNTRYAWDLWVARNKNDKDFETWRDKVEEIPRLAAKWPRYAQLTEFYGKPGTGLKSVSLPYPMRLAWDLNTEINSFKAHHKVADVLEQIFVDVLRSYGLDGVRRLRLDRFGGCFNSRPMRGGSKLSTHAWGIAVDIDPERNQYKWGGDKATLDDKEYEPFWKIVEATGAVSLGRKYNFDWMHFQFCEQ
jgi:hypothetical protein